MYVAEVESFTHKNKNQVIVSKKFLNAGECVLIIDDFLANGCALQGLISIAESAGATVAGCGIAIAALSLSIGLGFTQVPEMFGIFPDIIRTIFAENCVAVVFLAAIIMNLIMPKEKNT